MITDVPHACHSSTLSPVGGACALANARSRTANITSTWVATTTHMRSTRDPRGDAVAIRFENFGLVLPGVSNVVVTRKSEARDSLRVQNKIVSDQNVSRAPLFSA